MKVAIVHDWLVTYAGSERVVEQLLGMYPQADLFALFDFLPTAERDFLGAKLPRTSFLQRAPLVRKKYPRYLPLMPLAIEQFDLSAYDLVLSSSHCVAKGVLTGPDQLHVCYTHSPMRYAWDLQHEYLRGANLERGLKSWMARWMLHKLRLWDVSASNGVDAFAANSHFIARRLQKTYRRPATVIYPPVDVDAFSLREEKDDFYLTASRLVPYKRVDLLVQAFTQMPEKRLIVIGEGTEFARLRGLAGPNVRLLGFQDRHVLRDYMERAKAFLFASQEDFGIVLVEAQACGTPVIAFGKGGALETVRGRDQSDPTGMFFAEQTISSVTQAVKTFEREAIRFEPAACRANAERFRTSRFVREFGDFVQREWVAFQAGTRLDSQTMANDATAKPALRPETRHAA